MTQLVTKLCTIGTTTDGINYEGEKNITITIEYNDAFNEACVQIGDDTFTMSAIEKLATQLKYIQDDAEE